ncbi:hypothetical protein ACHAXA_003459, partial [Cyclostephanos tholiformis]
MDRNQFIQYLSRVQSERNVSVKIWLNEELLLIFCYLILPEECYHLVIERHVENPTSRTMKDGCVDQCSYCNGSYENFGARISKSQLIAILTTQVFHQGLVSATAMALI